MNSLFIMPVCIYSMKDVDIGSAISPLGFACCCFPCSAMPLAVQSLCSSPKSFSSKMCELSFSLQSSFLPSVQNHVLLCRVLQRHRVTCNLYFLPQETAPLSPFTGD